MGGLLLFRHRALLGVSRTSINLNAVCHHPHLGRPSCGLVPGQYFHEGRPMKRSTLLPLLFLACSQAPPPERYGFVAVLGNDTVSVERVERSPTRLVTDGVD